MLDRFKVPLEDQVHVSEAALRQTVAAIFEKCNLTPEDAAIGADVLVTTDLRGVESHGVSNMLRSYVQSYQKGDYNPRPNWRIVRESPSTATIDGDDGLGIILGPKAMRIAIDKAKAVGVGIVTMYNGRHLGAVGHHAMLAAQEDMVGMCMTATQPSVVPTFGAEPRFGTNPIAIAAPAKQQPAVLFDVATSAVAGNKIGLATRVGSNLLPGWVTTPRAIRSWRKRQCGHAGSIFSCPWAGHGSWARTRAMAWPSWSKPCARCCRARCPLAWSVTPAISTSLRRTISRRLRTSTLLKRIWTRCSAGCGRPSQPPGEERVLYPGLLEYEEERERREHGIPSTRK